MHEEQNREIMEDPETWRQDPPTPRIPNYKSNISSEKTYAKMYDNHFRNTIPGEDPVLRKYEAYLRSVKHLMPGNNLSKQLRSVAKMFHWLHWNVTGEETCPQANLDYLDNVQMVWNYFQNIGKIKQKDSTLIDIQDYFKFHSFLIFNFELTPEKTVKLEIILLGTKNVQTGFNRRANMDRMNRLEDDRLSGNNRIVPVYEVQKAIERKEPRKYVHEAIRRRKHELENNLPVTDGDHSIIARYLVAIMALGHFHRPGVIQNMTVREFERAQFEDGTVTIVVMNHKTATKYTAKTVLSEKEYRYFEAYRDFFSGQKIVNQNTFC